MPVPASNISRREPQHFERGSVAAVKGARTAASDRAANFANRTLKAITM
jgi:hypothetical protein